MTWRIDDPQGSEALKVRYAVVPYTRGAVLDMGCGPSKAFGHFIGVDSGKDTELFGIEMKPDVVCDVADPEAIERTFNAESVDAIFSSHCLEHVEDYQAALKAWWTLLKDGGHLCLYLPHADLYPRIGEPGANPDHKHDFLPADIERAMLEVGEWDLVVNETRAGGMEYSFLQVYRKGGEGHRRSHCNPRPKKTACVVRYGAIGDMIQAAAIFAGLKAEGFHVTAMVETKNADLVRLDPNIDAFILQDKDQVPNQYLHDYWAEHKRHYDRFVNLCESVEGTLLALPSRANHSWPWAMRHRHMNHNYIDFSAEIAGLEGAHLTHRFYPSPEEIERAEAVIDGMGLTVNKDWRLGQRWKRPFVVMWCLSGSSVHKFYPHQDAIMARILLDFPEAVIITVGDELSAMLEAGWENEPRVRRTAGEMAIRDTLALAQRCDLVIGPETGVLNSVAFEGNGKVVLLSHSSHENLTKHWVNTIGLGASETSCYPCHQLHFDHEHCPQHEQSGASLCQWQLSPVRVWAAVESIYERWAAVAKLVAA
jgi:ADP-heptose:LPS heptosyltransferase/predicted SAM-dependent methyltransferase